MAHLTALAHAALLGAASLTAGCAHCLPTRDREAVDAELVVMNRARAEPAMLAAAERHGATLLPAVAGARVPPLCGTPEADYQWFCLLPLAREGVYRVEKVGGPAYTLERYGSFIVVVDTHRPSLAPYFRLARAGHSLLLLIPDVTRRPLRSAEACFCEDGETIDPSRFSFVIDDPDLDPTDIKEVHFPMVEDFVEWRCRMRAT